MKKAAQVILIIGISALIGLCLGEGLLRALGLPRFYRQHSSPAQFSFRGIVGGQVLYFNLPSQNIRFVYDGNPRGYFDAGNAVDQLTNPQGFRGQEFSWDRPARVFRIAFLGDSFTFGEGVKFSDTYPEQAVSFLRRACAGRQVNFESYNFGVGGYNTAIEAVLLRELVLGFKPDLVVVKYGIDDAEPPLFAPDAATGQIQRVLRWYEQPGAVAESRPPENFLFRLRLAGLYWQARQSRRQNAQMLSYFRSLLRPDSPQWQESRAALQEILRLCRQEDLPCIVVFFPLLYELNRHYPFAYAHEALRRDTEEAGGIFVDLLPKLKGKEARRMWVHPSDHHPNEACHRIAAEAIAQKALSNAAVLRKIDEAAKR